jgi:hypothetical protein
VLLIWIATSHHAQAVRPRLFRAGHRKALRRVVPGTVAT